MSNTDEIIWRWTGEAMFPWRRYALLAGQRFVLARDYRLEAVEAKRSRKSHNHYFKGVQEAFRQLPEGVDGEWANEEDFRKWALVDTGYYDAAHYLCDDEEKAVGLSIFVNSIVKDYHVTLVHGRLVEVRTAKSQSEKAMGKKEFEASKKDVLEHMCKLIGISVEELLQNAGKAA